MRQRSRKSRHHYFVLVGMLLLVGVIVSPATAVASTPSQDQYTFNLPTPQGQKPAGGHAPVAQPNNLSPSQQAAASGPDSSQLTQIATSPQLGAPQTQASGHSKHSRSKHSGTGHSGGGPGGGSGNSGGGPGTKVDLAGTQPSVPAAVSNTVGGGPVLGLFAALAAIAVAGAFTALRRRRNRTGEAGR